MRSCRMRVTCAGSIGSVNSMVRATKTMTSWKWDERLAAVVDPGAAENVIPARVCSHVKLSATRRSEAGIG